MKRQFSLDYRSKKGCRLVASCRHMHFDANVNKGVAYAMLARDIGFCISISSFLTLVASLVTGNSMIIEAVLLISFLSLSLTGLLCLEHYSKMKKRCNKPDPLNACECLSVHTCETFFARADADPNYPVDIRLAAIALRKDRWIAYERSTPKAAKK